VSTILIGLVIVVMALALLSVVKALLASRSRSSDMVGQIGEYGFSGVAAAATVTTTGDEPRARPRTLAEASAALGDALLRRQGGEKEIRQRLVSAGLYTRTARWFVAAQVLTAGILLLLWIVVAGLADVSGVIYFAGMPAAAIGGWTLPSFVLSRRIGQRFHQIDKDLPNLIDLLVVMVEAGVGFAGAMRIATEQLKGPLGDELRVAVQEQNMGVSVEQSLRDMAVRADTPGVRALVRAIVQGELLGVSIAQILRNLANDMRKKRKARAEEQAQKAPVKMLFPLVLLIFPAMFIVLLLPALIQIKNTLGS
jgi:tight adherence protein C